MFLSNFFGKKPPSYNNDLWACAHTFFHHMFDSQKRNARLDVYDHRTCCDFKHVSTDTGRSRTYIEILMERN